MIKKIIVKDFSLKHTIECGQFFMYEINDKVYYITHFDTIFLVYQEDNILYYSGVSEKDITKLFGLDYNIEFLKTEEDIHIKNAIDLYWGMRLMKQDLWQCMIGFVCSSASNIPKIRKNLYLISEFFGEKIEIDNKEFYRFPKPGEINDLEKLMEAKTGYRGKFIYEINRIVKENPNILNEIIEMNYEDAKKELMKFPGIGSKVADCICLFSLGHEEAFPVDTWVKQAIEKLYLKKEVKNIKEIEMFVKEKFKENGGLKQQYLFHYARNNLKFIDS